MPSNDRYILKHNTEKSVVIDGSGNILPRAKTQRKTQKPRLVFGVLQTLVIFEDSSSSDEEDQNGDIIAIYNVHQHQNSAENKSSEDNKQLPRQTQK